MNELLLEKIILDRQKKKLEEQEPKRIKNYTIGQDTGEGKPIPFVPDEGRDESYDKWTKQPDGGWKQESSTSKLSQFGAGIMRPYERMLGQHDKSLMSSYKTPYSALTTGEKVSRGAGELVGYGSQFLGLLKGGKGVYNYAVPNVVKQGVKSFAKKSVAKKVATEAVKDAAVMGVQGAINSGGDVDETVGAAAIGAAIPFVGNYVAKPVFKKMFPNAGDAFRAAVSKLNQARAKYGKTPEVKIAEQNIKEEVGKQVKNLKEDKVVDLVTENPNEILNPIKKATEKTAKEISEEVVKPVTEAVPSQKKIYHGKEDLLIEEAKNFKNVDDFIKAKFNEKPKYGMSHRPTWEGSPPSHNLLEGDMLPRDVYIKPEWSIASGRNLKEDVPAMQSWEALKSIRNKPNSDVTVYRAGQKNELNTGDWVTFSKEYAEQSLEGSEKVHSFKVKSKDVLFAGDDINEFGYYPKQKIVNAWNKSQKQQGVLPTEITTKKELVQQAKALVEGENPAAIIPEQQPLPGPGQEVRGFSKTMAESPRTSPELKTKIKENQTEFFYDVAKDVDAKNFAENIVKTDIDAAHTMVKDPNIVNKDMVATAQKLIDKATLEGDHELAYELTKGVSEKLTQAGQTSQAASMWNKQTPAGLLKHINNVIKQTNENLVPKKHITLKPEVQKKFMDHLAKIKEMPEGHNKTIATQVLLRDIAELAPTSIWKQISSIQAMFQLLNPKTVNRNIIGNAIFGTLDNYSQAQAAALDKVYSKMFNKPRSVSYPNLIEQFKGAGGGIKKGVLDTWHSVNTSGMATHFELPQSAAGGRLFRKWYNPFSVGEKGLNLVLRVPDRAFTDAYIRDYVAEAARLAKLNKVKFDPAVAKKEAMEWARYRTFQDDSAIAGSFKKIKSAFNLGQDWGAGDFVMKYAKTPGNLIDRGINYSPINFLITLGKVTKGKGLSQRDIMMNISRATTGTGVIGFGYYLADLGLLTAKPLKDNELANIETSSGKSRYTLNSTGMLRYKKTGNPDDALMQEGDKLITFDWAQPVSLPLTIGANMALDGKDKTASETQIWLDSILSAANTIWEQPVLSGATRALRTGNVEGVGKEIIKGSVSSFTPTLLSQINQYRDNTGRSFYSADTRETAINLAKYKIPGLAQTLPERFDLWGNPVQRYQDGSNTFFNVFLNPAFVKHYKPDPQSKFVLDLFSTTGETKHAPRFSPRSLKVGGYEFKPDIYTSSKMQKYAGERYRDMYIDKMSNKMFMEADDLTKVDMLSKEISKIGSMTKLHFFGEEALKKAEAEDNIVKVLQIKSDLERYKNIKIAEETNEVLSSMNLKEMNTYIKSVNKIDPDLAKTIANSVSQKKFEYIEGLPKDKRTQAYKLLPNSIKKRVNILKQKHRKMFQYKELSKLTSKNQAKYLLNSFDQQNMTFEQRKEYTGYLKKKGIIGPSTTKWMKFYRKQKDKNYELPKLYGPNKEQIFPR